MLPNQGPYHTITGGRFFLPVELAPPMPRTIIMDILKAHQGAEKRNDDSYGKGRMQLSCRR